MSTPSFAYLILDAATFRRERRVRHVPVDDIPFTSSAVFEPFRESPLHCVCAKFRFSPCSCPRTPLTFFPSIFVYLRAHRVLRFIRPADLSKERSLLEEPLAERPKNVKGTGRCLSRSSLGTAFRGSHYQLKSQNALCTYAAALQRHILDFGTFPPNQTHPTRWHFHFV